MCVVCVCVYSVVCDMCVCSVCVCVVCVCIVCDQRESLCSLILDDQEGGGLYDSEDEDQQTEEGTVEGTDYSDYSGEGTPPPSSKRKQKDSDNLVIIIIIIINTYC